jgi:Leucine-rich repeat (LRR) protein
MLKVLSSRSFQLLSLASICSIAVPAIRRSVSKVAKTCFEFLRSYIETNSLRGRISTPLSSSLDSWVKNAPTSPEKGEREIVKTRILEALRINSTSIDLSSFYRLTSLPDLNQLTSIIGLNLSNCSSLTSLPDLSHLTNLTHLNLSKCFALTSLPSLNLLTSLTHLYLSDCHLLTSLPSLNLLTRLTTLDLSDCSRLTSLPDLSSLTSLTHINLSKCFALTSLPSLNLLTSLTHINLSKCFALTSLPSLNLLTRLTTLDLSDCSRLTSLPPLSSLTSLTHLRLSRCSNLTSLPPLSSLTSLTYLDLSYCSRLASLPDSICNMSSALTINLTNTGLSEAVLTRLRETVQVPGYNGPRFHVSMTDHHTASESLAFEVILAQTFQKAQEPTESFPNLAPHTEHLTSWLNRLSWTCEGGARDTTQRPLFYKMILQNLRFANENEEFRGHFSAIIEDADTTCGDRVALSILHMGIVRNYIHASDLASILKSIKESWIIELLEGCAREKVKTLRFVDEIEVYLGYPIKLKDRLGLSIDISNMLYFQCSGITEENLQTAHAYVTSRMTREALVDRLIKDDRWKKALQTEKPTEISAIDSSYQETGDAKAYITFYKELTNCTLASMRM